ncbi:MAG: type IV pilus secretin PilQ [Myxococcota bacterium]
MFASLHEQSHAVARRLLRGVALAGLAALAAGVGGTRSASAERVLTELRVDHEGDTTVIGLVGVSDPIFSAFQREDPARLVVDLTGIEVEAQPAALPVHDGLVEEVRVSSFETGDDRNARVELALAAPATHELREGENGFEIRITPKAPESPEAETLGALGSSEPQATRLLTLAAEESAEGTRIRLEADGPLSDVETFVLEQPDRLVLDLVGLSGSDAPAVVEIGGEHADRIRIGEHADKVRVVIDGGSAEAPFAGFSAEPTAEGLLLRLGGGVALAAERPSTLDPQPGDEPVPAAPAPGVEPVEPSVAEAEAEPETVVAEAEPELPGWIEEARTEASPAEEVALTPEPVTKTASTAKAKAPEAPAQSAPGATRIYGVQLDAQETLDRVVVLSDGPVEHEIVDLDPDTLVLRLHGATIDPDAAVRLAPEDTASLSLVTAFQQPDVSRPEVRVVMKRATGLEPQISQRGTMLFLDFPHTTKTAKRPPLYERQQERPASIAPAARAAANVARAQAELAPPAALEIEEGLGVLQEGGLTEGKHYAGRRISLDFKDVEIDDVLRLIADVSDLNIIAGDEVDGKVTIRLVDVPWDQALDVILLTKGLGFVRVGNVLRIAPSELLASEEEARLQERRAKEKLEDLVVKLQPVNYASVKEVSQMVKRLLTPRGTVDVDQRTNTVILKDIPSVIDEATALIKAIDTQTPQVLIEAKIVEARLDFSREIGSTWAFGASPIPQNSLNGGEDLVFHDGSGLLTGFTDTFNHVSVANPITSVANGLLDLGAFILDEQFNLELRLEAAESNGDGKVISSPRVVTLDNREAEIQQGVSIPFQTFENGDAQLEFVDAVLKLKVTPHITADRSIIMDIEVERNAPDDSVQTPTGSPAIAKNEAKTETLVKDGQTLVIGGIYVISKSDRTSGVPFFNKIPLLGAAFRNVETRDQRNELLIFVTPRIVVNRALAS